MYNSIICHKTKNEFILCLHIEFISNVRLKKTIIRREKNGSQNRKQKILQEF